LFLFVSGLIASDVKSKAQALEHRKIILKLFLGSFCRSEFAPTHERGSACLFTGASLGRTASRFPSQSAEHHRRTTLFVCGHASLIRERLSRSKPKT
jgi:hypothetical protein